MREESVALTVVWILIGAAQDFVKEVRRRWLPGSILTPDEASTAFAMGVAGVDECGHLQ